MCSCMSGQLKTGEHESARMQAYVLNRNHAAHNTFGRLWAKSTREHCGVHTYAADSDIGCVNHMLIPLLTCCSNVISVLLDAA